MVSLCISAGSTRTDAVVSPWRNNLTQGQQNSFNASYCSQFVAAFTLHSRRLTLEFTGKSGMSPRWRAPVRRIEMRIG